MDGGEEMWISGQDFSYIFIKCLHREKIEYYFFKIIICTFIDHIFYDYSRNNNMCLGYKDDTEFRLEEHSYKGNIDLKNPHI